MLFGNIFDKLCNKTSPLLRNSLFFGLVFFCISVFGQDSLDEAIAEKGDGIYSFLRKNGVDPYNSYKDFISLNEAKLKDSIQLLEGMTYLIPKKIETQGDTVSAKEPGTKEEDTEEGVTYKIFGEKYKNVPSKSKRLSGTVYYLVSGHGGPDPGAMTKYKGKSIAEDEYAYDVTLRLARELISHDAMVYIIVRDLDDGIRDAKILEMDKDEVVYPAKKIPYNQKARLDQRVTAVNNLYRKNKGKHQRLIVTHVDSRSTGQNIDVFFYHHEKSKNGKKLAESIHQTFKQKYQKYQPNRTYSGTFQDRSSLYVVKKTLPAMTFIEIGNIRNTKDQKRILDHDNRQALAKWISEGILLDYESK